VSDPSIPSPGQAAKGSEPPRMPAWVKWPGVALIVLVVVFLALQLFGVEHGPGMHRPGQDTSPAPGVPSDHVPSGGHG
jgi:hypothetical protein